MKRRRIFVSASQISGGQIVFSVKDIHYLKSVLRLRIGDPVQVFDGAHEYAVQLETGDAGNLIGRVLDRARQEDPADRFQVTLAFGCVRPGPFSEILRHGTELGVCRFIPLLSRRATRRPAEKKERWEAIVKSAAEQCGRVQCPEVEAPVVLEDFLGSDRRDHTRLLLSPSAQATPLLEILETERPSEAIVLVGPEGGFHEDEEAHAVRSGFVPVSLGSNILRTETAALMAGGLLLTWHDWYRRREHQW